VDITVQDITTVDKEVTIKADDKDLAPKFDKALRSYRKKINMPGFRPGSAPLGIVKKRFGKEIETEQINEFVQEVFQNEIIPKHNPIGEPRIDKMNFENGNLEVTIKIGVKPEFEPVDVSTLTVDKMVYDVTEEDVDKEVDFALKRHSEKVETDEPVSETSVVTVDAVRLDEAGEPVEDDKDEDKELDLSDEANADFLAALKGKKAGDEATVTLGEGDTTDTYRLALKSVKKTVEPELNEEFFKKASNDRHSTLEEFRSYLKSSVQDYYDQASNDMLRDRVVEEIIEAHSFEVPEVLVEQILSRKVDELARRNKNQLPPDFDIEGYFENTRPNALMEAKWMFIASAYMEKFEDLELKPEDVDSFMQAEAAKYGLSVDMIKNYYASSPEQLENLRNTIRTDKLFKKLTDEIGTRDLGRDAYREKYSKKNNPTEK
jgi:trigger factor